MHRMPDGWPLVCDMLVLCGLPKLLFLMQYWSLSVVAVLGKDILPTGPNCRMNHSPASEMCFTELTFAAVEDRVQITGLRIPYSLLKQTTTVAVMTLAMKKSTSKVYNFISCQFS